MTSALGWPAQAARLGGAAAAVRQDTGTLPLPVDQAALQAALDGARAAVGEAAFAGAWAAGSALTPQQAAKEAPSKRAPRGAPACGGRCRSWRPGACAVGMLLHRCAD